MTPGPTVEYVGPYGGKLKDEEAVLQSFLPLECSKGCGFKPKLSGAIGRYIVVVYGNRQRVWKWQGRWGTDYHAAYTVHLEGGRECQQNLRHLNRS